jgi:hypothetical protein
MICSAGVPAGRRGALAVHHLIDAPGALGVVLLLAVGDEAGHHLPIIEDERTERDRGGGLQTLQVCFDLRDQRVLMRAAPAIHAAGGRRHPAGVRGEVSRRWDVLRIHCSGTSRLRADLPFTKGRPRDVIAALRNRNEQARSQR